VSRATRQLVAPGSSSPPARARRAGLTAGPEGGQHMAGSERWSSRSWPRPFARRMDPIRVAQHVLAHSTRPLTGSGSAAVLRCQSFVRTAPQRVGVLTNQLELRTAPDVGRAGFASVQ
jgi:hypothetical protein